MRYSFAIAVALCTQDHAWAELAPTADSPGAWALRWEALSLEQREKEIFDQLTAPDATPSFVPITVRREIDGIPHELTYQAAADYLKIGPAEHPFWLPLSPIAAQALADHFDCILPTATMVDQIYAAAAVKLTPIPLPPSSHMTRPATFWEHSQKIQAQIPHNIRVKDSFFAGHKKDVVLWAEMPNSWGKVGIYGWHKKAASDDAHLHGTAEPSQPIQPLYTKHLESWVDYSHGVRLIRRGMRLNGRPITAEAVLADPKLHPLLNPSGPLFQTRYHKDRLRFQTLTPGVRVGWRSPRWLDKEKPLRLILFATANGSSIEQTLGRPAGWMTGADEPRFQNHQIGRQIDWLRENDTAHQYYIAVLEPQGQSWPAWRKKHDPKNQIIRSIVETLRQSLPRPDVPVTLTGHSGGGSFTFGFLNGVEEIPGYIERIAFLDSHYGYDSALGHATKLTRWLKDEPARRLFVLGYRDFTARYQGQPFVSESAGTWGRGLAMANDLSQAFDLKMSDASPWKTWTDAQSSILIQLHLNPEQKILHSQLVEKNGLLHALLWSQPQSPAYSFWEK